MKDVTVIIPSYVIDEQSYAWLKECISSALKQDCQVVVYDDYSPVDVGMIIGELNSENLKVYKGTSHRGVSYARNRAAEYAITNLILPLDCDDLLEDGAVDKMLSVWTGIPVYPDLSKFGMTEVSHYRLLDFSCDLLKEKLGISSVNVLHSVDQWRSIGGWNEKLDLYEDAEYNARLMLTYCGVNYHEPLVRYRQHPSQKTRKVKDSVSSVEVSRDILNSLRRITMTCPSCGGKRRSVVEATAINRTVVAVNPANLPGEKDGRILALYTGGKGQGTHYYKGVATHFAYKVLYGEYYYVDPMDATSSATPGRRSLFVKVEKPEVQTKVAEQKLQEVENISRTPVAAVTKSPIEEVVVESETLPDIANMTVSAINDLDLASEQVQILLDREKSGRNRSGVKTILSKKLKE